MKIRTSIDTALLAVSFDSAMPAALAHGDSHRKKEKGIILSTEEKEFGRQGAPQACHAHHPYRNGRHHALHTVRHQSPARRNHPLHREKQWKVSTRNSAWHDGGTEGAWRTHEKNPEMEHDEPYMAHIKPGAREEMVWQFTKPGHFNFGCLAPGHFEAGMVGKINVTKR